MKTILTVMAFTLTILTVSAQPKPDKMRAARIEFMKKKLALTPDEEKKFLPIYEKMIDEMHELRKEFREDIDIEEMDLTFKTDKECEKIVDDIIKFKEKEVEIIKRYNEEFKKVLPIKKVAMIYKAEMEFKKKVLEQLREKRKKGKED